MKRIKQIHGFTLLEVLAAMAIIAVMIGLLIPAIGKIQTMASVVRQRAQFNAIGAALEAFRSDSGRNDYPPSSYTKDSDGTENGQNSITNGYAGAQKLAEALVGWDGFGFHPKSLWRSDGQADFDGDGTVELIYDVVNGVKSGATVLQPPADNLACRKGPYLELEKANAVKVSSIYTSSTNFALNTYVLTDMFRKRSCQTGKTTGMPILYFRADTAKTWSASDAQGIPTTPPDCIYNIYNNFYTMIAAPWAATNTPHPMRGDISIFYQRIKNPNFPGTLANNFADARPYRSDSYILLSAGPDGLYGTVDDIYNFDENE
jgi:prepilin-type N-terminal cleavage/methylation domain-containing protein